jgi:hypothetical protein
LASLSSGVAYGQQQHCGTDDANDCEGSSEVTLPFDKDLASDIKEDFDKDNPIVLPFP